MTIECTCGNTVIYDEYNCQCHDDIIDQTGWSQDEDGNWKCKICIDQEEEVRRLEGA